MPSSLITVDGTVHAYWYLLNIVTFGCQLRSDFQGEDKSARTIPDSLVILYRPYSSPSSLLQVQITIVHSRNQ